ncbi:MAG: DUF2493 domain-containing protein [Gammaproteobacteria bacterium]|nr:DUF2493 domain-containing protein [Gammaproteobacteria bacterium]
MGGARDVVEVEDSGCRASARPGRREVGSSPAGRRTAKEARTDLRRHRRPRLPPRETRARLPNGTLVAVTGGKHVTDANAVFARLDKMLAKYRDMVLVHGGGSGVEKLAAQWAERNGVHQVVCKPDWNRHGRAAPFRRNGELLNLMPKGTVVFPGSGITDNLVEKAMQLGIPVQKVAA